MCRAAGWQWGAWAAALGASEGRLLPPSPLPPLPLSLPTLSPTLSLGPLPAAPFQLWDTAGQERFRTIAVAYFRGANAILLVFDLTTRSSFMAVEGWVRDIDKNADKKVAKILVGNKADLADGEGKRVVSAAEATKMAEAHNMAYMETSAKSGVNVDAAFERLAALALANVKREKQEGSSATAAAPSAKPLNLKKEEREQDKGRGGKSWC